MRGDRATREAHVPETDIYWTICHRLSKFMHLQTDEGEDQSRIGNGALPVLDARGATAVSNANLMLHP